MRRTTSTFGFGDASERRLLGVFTEVLTVDVPDDDGVIFGLASLSRS